MIQTDTLKKPCNELTFADLRLHFSTGRSFIKSGSGRDAVYGYRHGVMTDVGDIEESARAQLMMDLIKRSGEEGIQMQLRLWAKENCAWLHSKKEIEMYALELHSSRIFDNPQWVDYDLFNREYRPKAAGQEWVKRDIL